MLDTPVLEEHSSTIFRAKGISQAKQHTELLVCILFGDWLAYALTVKIEAAYYSKK
jgi:hypothetical protein